MVQAAVKQNDESEEVIPPGSEFVGQRIKKARKAKGLNQTEVAEAIELERSAVGNWEQGRTFPSLSVTQRLADFLEVDIIWLAYGQGDAEAPSAAVVIPKAVVKEDGGLDVTSAISVDRKVLNIMGVPRGPASDALVCLESVFGDDLGGAGSLILIDKDQVVPGIEKQVYAVADGSGWFSAQLSTVPLEPNKIAVYSEKLGLDSKVDSGSLTILGKVYSIMSKV